MLLTNAALGARGSPTPGIVPVLSMRAYSVVTKRNPTSGRFVSAQTLADKSGRIASRAAALETSARSSRAPALKYCCLRINRRALE